MLNFFASLAFYGALAAVCFGIPFGIYLAVKWFIEALQCNKRAYQWAQRHSGIPLSSDKQGQRWWK